MATLRQIAEHAEVSVATASRVLNGSAPNHPVSEVARERVRAAAASLGYTPNATAKALRSQRSMIMGVIASDILDPYFAELTRGIEIEAAKAGFVTVIANANRDPYQERMRFRVLQEHHASGIVFCGSDIVGMPGTRELADDVSASARRGTRIVALAPRTFETASIAVDDEQVGRTITEHLLQRGHRSIAFAGGTPGLASLEARERGYRSAMAGAGLPPRAIGKHGMSQEAGRMAIASMLESGPLPDAIVLPNDELAIGAFAALWQRQISVPNDISLATIGGTHTAMSFGITCLKLPLRELGALAARYIADAGSDSIPSPPPVELWVGSTVSDR